MDGRRWALELLGSVPRAIEHARYIPFPVYFKQQAFPPVKVDQWLGLAVKRLQTRAHSPRVVVVTEIE